MLKMSHSILGFHFELGELGKVSYGILKLGLLGEVSLEYVLKLGELGEVSFGILKSGEFCDFYENETFC